MGKTGATPRRPREREDREGGVVVLKAPASRKQVLRIRPYPSHDVCWGFAEDGGSALSYIPIILNQLRRGLQEWLAALAEGAKGLQPPSGHQAQHQVQHMGCCWGCPRILSACLQMTPEPRGRAVPKKKKKNRHPQIASPPSSALTILTRLPYRVQGPSQRREGSVQTT